jgi:flagellar basal-body rod modification protein FlgD
LSSPVPSTGYTPISSAVPKTTTETKKPANELGQDAFLKLLVAQLKYQDPSSPADGTQFLTQTAQFTQVEKLDAIIKEQQNMLAAQNMLSASNMIGKTVTFLGVNGAIASGVVTSATIQGSNPTLRVGDMDVELSQVKEVRNSTA